MVFGYRLSVGLVEVSGEAVSEANQRLERFERLFRIP
jgi:hypothetical protein